MIYVGLRFFKAIAENQFANKLEHERETGSRYPTWRVRRT